MSRYVTEFVGTFFLVLTIGLVVLDGTPMAPIAIGSVLMAMVYMGGHISGAHYNPAVSVAILIRGKMKARELAPYVTAQISGAILASLAVMLIVGDTFAPAPAPEAGLVVVLLCEALFTFALSLVILNVATDDATAGNRADDIGVTVADIAKNPRRRPAPTEARLDQIPAHDGNGACFRPPRQSNGEHTFALYH